MVKAFGELIYTPEKAEGEAISKAETHTPKIIAPDKVKAGEPFEVKIEVGPHVMNPEHNIGWVELYFYEEGRAFNPIFLGRAAFAPQYTEPKVTFTIKLQKSGVLYAISYCNLHGLWEGRKEIKVE